MSVNVPLEALRSELDARANAGYLVTVSDAGSPHCVAVTVGWEGDELVIASGRTSGRNATARRQVTLLAPAPVPPASDAEPGPSEESPTGGYSLIVDAEVLGSTEHRDGSVVRMRPVHAVLHRPAVAPDGARLHDCSPVFDEARPEA